MLITHCAESQRDWKSRVHGKCGWAFNKMADGMFVSLVHTTLSSRALSIPLGNTEMSAYQPNWTTFMCAFIHLFVHSAFHSVTFKYRWCLVCIQHVFRHKAVLYFFCCAVGWSLHWCSEKFGTHVSDSVLIDTDYAALFNEDSSECLYRSSQHHGYALWLAEDESLERWHWTYSDWWPTVTSLPILA